jgi:uncharacterized membrane protein (Fun14 family)
MEYHCYLNDKVERHLLNIENITSMSVTIDRGYFVGVLIGCVKVAKIVVIVIGLFLVGLIYLQYQQIVTINSNKLQQLFQDTVTTHGWPCI